MIQLKEFDENGDLIEEYIEERSVTQFFCALSVGKENALTRDLRTD